jgi:hypothetical protein
VIVLGCLAFWFCLFLGTNEKNLLQREKTQLGKQGPPLRSYWHFDSQQPEG